jgi:hypothetical protein
MSESTVPGPGSRILTAGAVVLMVCALALTGAACFVLYRTGRAVDQLSATAARLGERLDRIGAKGERVGESAAGVAEDIAKLSRKVEGLTDRMDLVEGWNDALHGGPGRMGDGEEKLVRELLAAVRGADLKFVRGGEEKSGLRMYAWLYAKYQIWKPTIASADEFISKVASEALTGTPYQVVGKDGSRRPLADWLKERLAALRAAPAQPK